MRDEKSSFSLFQSLCQPDVSQVLVDVVTRCDLPAFHFSPMRHDALPPQSGRELICLLIDNTLFELPDKLQPFFRVRCATLLIVKFIQHAVMVSGIIDGTLFAADELEELQIGVVHEITSEIDAGVVVALAKIIEIGSFFLLHVIDIESNLTPLIDDVDSGDFVRLSYVAILERKRKPFRHSSFF